MPSLTEIKRFVGSMRKRGAEMVEVADVVVRFPSGYRIPSVAEMQARAGCTPREMGPDEEPEDDEDTRGMEAPEVHPSPEDLPPRTPDLAPDPGPMEAALDAPLQAENPDVDPDNFETWYHTTPKPASFAR